MTRGLQYPKQSEWRLTGWAVNEFFVISFSLFSSFFLSFLGVETPFQSLKTVRALVAEVRRRVKIISKQTQEHDGDTLAEADLHPNYLIL